MFDQIGATVTATATTAAKSLSTRWAVLAIVLIAEVMDLIDGTIVNVAAPAIRGDIGGSDATMQWLVAA